MTLISGYNQSAWEALIDQDRLNPKQTPRKRWRKAQAAEQAFWRNWRQNPLYGHIDLAGFWADVLAKTGGPRLAGHILDIGCGPVPALNFWRDAETQALGVDPLAAFYSENHIVESGPGLEPIAMWCGGGESIPIRDQVADQVFCFNVLDHVAQAESVLQEIRRILKPDGFARIYVHTFKAWICPFLFWDTPHVYHWSPSQFEALLQNHGFRIQTVLHEPKTFDLPSSLWGRLRNLPYWVASHTAYTSYFQLTLA
ncbi:MAG: class I SAM-dependent methyltransferase [Acidobacteria bacterium]|nr:class I SAM-dependent methyltransferase [Acidobacteriota bacterium]MCB9397722.1 class I SAM-dependent methyltransferase [Acidobacteriota bacterium]